MWRSTIVLSIENNYYNRIARFVVGLDGNIFYFKISSSCTRIRVHYHSYATTRMLVLLYFLLISANKFYNFQLGFRNTSRLFITSLKIIWNYLSRILQRTYARILIWIDITLVCNLTSILLQIISNQSCHSRSKDRVRKTKPVGSIL